MPQFLIGNFRDAKVYVDSNYLTRLDESAFGIMLKQMSYGKGFIQAYKSLLTVIDLIFFIKMALIIYIYLLFGSN